MIKDEAKKWEPKLLERVALEGEVIGSKVDIYPMYPGSNRHTEPLFKKLYKVAIDGGGEVMLSLDHICPIEVIDESEKVKMVDVLIGNSDDPAEIIQVKEAFGQMIKDL